AHSRPSLSANDGDGDVIVIEGEGEGQHPDHGDVTADLRKTGVEQTWDRSETEAPTLRPPASRRAIPVLAIASAIALFVVGTGVAFIARSGPAAPPQSTATVGAIRSALPLAGSASASVAATVVIARDPWKPVTTPMAAPTTTSARHAVHFPFAASHPPSNPPLETEKPAPSAHGSPGSPHAAPAAKKAAQAKPFDLGY
ncbi:MAG: hypothetical protein ACREJ3_10660, partial [Polyangiaceae bacterium]